MRYQVTCTECHQFTNTLDGAQYHNDKYYCPDCLGECICTECFEPLNNATSAYDSGLCPGCWSQAQPEQDEF